MNEESTQAVEEQAADQESTGKEAKELERARREAANYRTKLRESEERLKELSPLAEQYRAAQDAQKTEAQKLAEQLQTLQSKLAEQERAAAQAQKLATLTRLATKAGVDPDLVEFLDVSKLDLADEKAIGAVFAKLGSKSGVSASNPGRGGTGGETDEEMRRYYLGGERGRTTIFGG